MCGLGCLGGGFRGRAGVTLRVCSPDMWVSRFVLVISSSSTNCSTIGDVFLRGCHMVKPHMMLQIHATTLRLYEAWILLTKQLRWNSKICVDLLPRQWVLDLYANINPRLLSNLRPSEGGRSGPSPHNIVPSVVEAMTCFCFCNLDI